MSSTTILNLDSDTAKNIIGSEATPILAITNSGAGESLKIDKVTLATPILAANATVGVTKIQGASVASGAVLAFTNNALVSCSTILFITGGVAGTKVIRIVTQEGKFGWIPVLPDSAVTAAAL